MTSITKLPPAETTVISASPPSLIRNAASTAFSSNPFTTGGIPGAGMTRLASRSILNADTGVSGSITCLTQTTILSGMKAPRACNIRSQSWGRIGI